MNSALDYGAAIVVPEIDVSASVLELDKLQRVADAEVGMKVVKSGAATGVTMGVVAEVTPVHRICASVEECVGRLGTQASRIG
jgi:hypothetical protein